MYILFVMWGDNTFPKHKKNQTLSAFWGMLKTIVKRDEPSRNYAFAGEQLERRAVVRGSLYGTRTCIRITDSRRT